MTTEIKWHGKGYYRIQYVDNCMSKCLYHERGARWFNSIREIKIFLQNERSIFNISITNLNEV